MFAATTLLYPCLLVVLCLGAGLLLDRLAGTLLPAALLIPVGSAVLIAVSQLSTYAYPLAPATPYLLLLVALAGYVFARARARAVLRSLRARPWVVTASLLAYAFALAPVLAAGRPSFSSFMALSDSAVHLIGADFLISHGQHYANLDLSNSYGQFINGYYNTSYPSGADTLFGAGARLIGLPLIWAFQPFNAFMLASGVGPAWMLARRMNLTDPLAAAAALSTVLPAVVFAYELFGSVKEISALPMILTLGALVSTHRVWLHGAPARAIPFALVLAAGVSALGVAFGAWALAAAMVLAVVLIEEMIRSRRIARPLIAVGVAAACLLIAAWPTWANVSGSIKVAQSIAVTSNPGNLQSPLRAIQVFGVWLGGSYKLSPAGTALTLTHALIAITFLAALLGALQLMRIRAHALAAWLALMLLVWLVVSESVTTWGGAKALMLTSPAVVLLAWGGVGALRRIPSPRVAALAPTGLALMLLAGPLASDAFQYHSSNLAPTARYDELASLNSRFAGRGPALFEDFDEYSLYELRSLDVGGPDFVYAPPSLAAAAGGYGRPVRLDALAPAALAPYPLIVTRVDPTTPRPPAAYRLLWHGSYYEVWGRAAGARPALVHRSLAGNAAQRCRAIGAVAGSAAFTTRLVAAARPPLISISLAGATHPRGWGRQRHGFVMKRPGRLVAEFAVPSGGAWELWVQGQIMPSVALAIDGHRVGSVGGALSGNSLVPDTIGPLAVSLAAGTHRLSVTRGAATLAPGDGGSAVLHAIFLTAAASSPAGTLTQTSTPRWRSLCGRHYDWVELLDA